MNYFLLLCVYRYLGISFPTMPCHASFVLPQVTLLLILHYFVAFPNMQGAHVALPSEFNTSLSSRTDYLELLVSQTVLQNVEVAMFQKSVFFASPGTYLPQMVKNCTIVLFERVQVLGAVLCLNFEKVKYGI